MELYEAIYKRRIVRDFTNKAVSDEVLEKIIDAALQAPTHDHLRNWEFVILKDKKDKEYAFVSIISGSRSASIYKAYIPMIVWIPRLRNAKNPVTSYFFLCWFSLSKQISNKNAIPEGALKMNTA